MIQLPDKFSKKLNESSNWSSNVNRIINNVSEYFMRTPFFFPEYTVHGEKHVNNVLAISNELVPDKCMDYLTSRDIALLVISLITHDIGMFLERDGVYSLLFGDYASRKTSCLDECTWKDAWEKHISKVRRYPDKMLVKVFGSATQILLPTSNMDEISYKDILVYGDFLRQYHPRISQEIVLTGFMGAETVDIFKDAFIDDETRSLVGLLVRSHGMNIRDTSTYLDERFTPPSKPKGIPIYYLMTILRLADYLDAGQGRAPHEIQSMNSQISPISRMEWDWNQSIDFQDYVWDKHKETLTIHSNPTDTTQFNNVEKWLSDVQRETDLCWAILGEYYGTEKKWLLSIRRINSNITDSKARQNFEKRYLTKPAALSVNPDILKLLIGPLYNNNPSCGIRELIQNAVDACRERYVKEVSLGNHDYKGNVVVKIDSENKLLIVSDNGIGMTSDTLINYYLIAGSSYRYSDNWVNDYIVNEKSTIPRTGKFGIGVLSSFLLGRKIHLETKYICDEVGLVLDLELNNSIINVTKSKKVNIGTEVRIQLTSEMLIKISEIRIFKSFDEILSQYEDYDIHNYNDFHEKVKVYDVIKRVKYEWYFLESPSIKYIVDECVKENKIYVPEEHTYYDNWFDMETSDFASYKWTYKDPLSALCANGLLDKDYYNPLFGVYITKGSDSLSSLEYNYSKGRLFCNGIVVPNITDSYSYMRYGLLPHVYVSIIDNDNKLEISLDRNTCELPYSRELAIEQFRHFIAKLLLCPTDVLRTGEYDGFNIVYYKDSFTLENKSFLTMAGIQFYYGVKDLMQSYDSFHHGLCNYAITDLKIDFNKIEDAAKKQETTPEDEFRLVFDRWLITGVKKIRCEAETLITLSEKIGDTRTDPVLSLVCSSSELENIFRLSSSPIVVEYETKARRDNILHAKFQEVTHDFEVVISELLGDDIWIPIDRKKRKEKFPLAFTDLERFMKQLDPENSK